MKKNQINFKSKLESGKAISKKSKHFKVSFEYIGEGFDGNFNPEDSEDRPLLRCDLIYNKEPDECMHNGSWCTNISTNVKELALNNLMEKMLNEMECLFKKHGKDNLGTISRLMSKYSWCETDELGDILTIQDSSC